jgi:NDP-sugar pyrophosphorylase family protein
LKLLVLAGGFGTRLKSVVKELPKALAPINDIPFLYYQIKNWKKQGVRDFVFLLYFQADMIISFLESEKSGILKNCSLKCIIEPKPLGTGGAIKYCINELSIKENFLVANADTWLGSGVKQLIKKNSPSLLIVEVEDSQRYGSVILRNNKIMSFKEKTNFKSKGLINAGLAILNPNFFNLSSDVFSLENQIFPSLVKKNLLVGLELKTTFIDIGVPDDYYRFIKMFKKLI